MTFLLTLVATLAPFQDAPHFPPATAIEVGLDPARVAAVDAVVGRLAQDGDVVGAELLIIKDGRTVLHTAHGWADRESETPMEPNRVFCVRSMTKPLIGAAVRMLEADGEIEFDDPIAKYLPEFDVDGKRGITIDQLLHHTSGLPMSQIVGKDLHSLENIRAVARLGAEGDLVAEPGTTFEYSDQGTDTLTAMIEVVTGAPPEDFVTARILGPLGMKDSVCVLAPGDKLRERSVSKYVGAPGAWTRYWKPDDRELFPIFLGSQGLYSTALDYARFLEMYLKRGRGGGERLLRPRAVRRTLEPGPFPMNASCGFQDVDVEYGSLMMLFMGQRDGERALVGFGHNGSDGTYAWAFPEHDALVMYFTQSRGQTTGAIVEQALDALLFGVPFDPQEAAPPLDEYTGYYIDAPDDRYRAIVQDRGRLAIEVLGKAVVPLQYLGDDRWRPTMGSAEILEFERDESGRVIAFHIDDHREYRLEPAEDLPEADEIIERVMRAHGAQHFESLGVMHTHSTATIEKLGMVVSSESWIDPSGKFRYVETVGDQVEIGAYDGHEIKVRANDAAVEVIDGDVAASMRNDTPVARFGDWRERYRNITVIQSLQQSSEGGDRAALLVRLGDESAPAPTMYIDVESGLVARMDEVTVMRQVGRIGRVREFHDYKSVGGVMLPHRTETVLANPMIGKVVTVIDSIETGGAVPDGWFALGDD